MMGVIGVFHGTDAERDALNAALMRNCTCGETPAECPAHSILRDERILAHLVFVRRCMARYIAAEWPTEAP